MSSVISFPIERARKAGEGIPAIVAVRGCEIRQFLRPAAIPERASEPLALPLRAERRRRVPEWKPVPPLPDEQKLMPMARARGLTPAQTCEEISILLRISDQKLAVQMLIALIGASNTHTPLPHGWPRVMYAIRGRISLHVGVGRTDTAPLLAGIRQLLAEETDTAWA